MKKEWAAAALLLLLVVGSYLHIRHVGRLTDETVSLTESACLRAENGDWDAAGADAEAALQVWRENAPYTHITLHQAALDNVTDALYGLLTAVSAQDETGTACAGRLAKDRLTGLYEAEGIGPGSIF